MIGLLVERRCFITAAEYCSNYKTISSRFFYLSLMQMFVSKDNVVEAVQWSITHHANDTALVT